LVASDKLREKKPMEERKRSGPGPRNIFFEKKRKKARCALAGNPERRKKKRKLMHNSWGFEGKSG